MRRIVGVAFVSLDGVMQAPGGPSEDPSGGFSEGGWQFKFPDAAGGEAVGDMLSGEYDLLLGGAPTTFLLPTGPMCKVRRPEWVRPSPRRANMC